MNGNKFKILGVELFNIVDFSGTKMGQAAVFKKYETEDGKVVEVKATPWQAPQVEVRHRGKHLCGRREGEWSAAALVAARHEGPLRGLRIVLSAHRLSPSGKGVNSLHAADGWPAMKRAAAAAACLVLCFQAVVMPSEEEIKEAEAQVEAWADYVRQLKAQGRGNKVCVNGWCCGRRRRLVLAAALNLHTVQ